MRSSKRSSALEARIKEIHRQYIEVVCPLVMQIEIYDGSFPVEVLNELRAILDHLSKSSMSETPDDAERNISKAEAHIRMAILDCFKYLCVSLDERYKQFERQYERYDLSRVNGGEFVRKLSEERKNAAKKLYEARMTDLEFGRGEAYEKYEAAYLAFSEVDDLIEEGFDKAAAIKKRAIREDWIVWIAIGIGIAGVLVGIWGVL